MRLILGTLVFALAILLGAAVVFYFGAGTAHAGSSCWWNTLTHSWNCADPGYNPLPPYPPAPRIKWRGHSVAVRALWQGAGDKIYRDSGAGVSQAGREYLDAGADRRTQPPVPE
jgi:hypothetical protein